MTDLAKAVAALALVSTTALAQSRSSDEPAVTSSGSTFQGAAGAKRLRGRLGILGGLHMQKTDLALGIAYDLLPVLERPLPVLLTADFTLGIRPREVTLLPAVLARVPLRLSRLPKVEPYVQAGLGFNLTFMRGGTALSMPLRFGLGGHYELRDRLGVGMQLDAEVGPLLAPFADSYSALHFAVVVAYALD